MRVSSNGEKFANTAARRWLRLHVPIFSSLSRSIDSAYQHWALFACADPRSYIARCSVAIEMQMVFSFAITFEHVHVSSVPTVLKYDGIASEEVGCSETPGYPLLHAAEGDRLRLSTIGLPDTSERVAFSIVCPGSWATMTFLALPLAD